MALRLSKSRYCRGIQCPKMLWMDDHMPELGESTYSESIIANGNMVGDLARGYFGDYELVEYKGDIQSMAEKTRKLIEKGVGNIAEAAFCYDELYCAVDILHRNGSSGYELVEVKSSTHVAPVYVDDVAFQYYVLTNCGIDVQKVCIMHLNSSYVRDGELELDKLFTIEDYTDEAIQRYSEVEENIRYLREYVDTDEEPARDIGPYCDNPYACMYSGYCGRHLPEESVFSIAGLRSARKYEYYNQGIISFEDIIRERPPMSSKQMEQVEVSYYNNPDVIDRESIKAFLDTLSYPLYHLDFETFQQAVPEYDGLRPYSQIPFQYSLHIEQADGSVEHREFLAKEGTDPRRAIAESLCNDFPTDVCVLAYNMAFERRVLRELAETFPDLADHLLDIRENIHDLMIPFRSHAYYSKAMQGSYSIKYVLPALCPGDPELDYHNLDGVHNGTEASATFADLPNHTPEEIAEMRQNLLNYCCLDTLAVVKVLEKLRKIMI